MGLFTPTAAGAIGVFSVTILSLIKRSITKKKFFDALNHSVRTVGMIIIIFVGAMMFNYFLAASTLTFELGRIISELSIPPIFTVAAILLMWLVLGCVMDAVGMIVLTIPVVFPLVVSLGFNPLWFSVLGVIMIEAGLITPPIGMNVYIIGGIAPDVPISKIFRGIMPFILAIIVCIVLIMIFPQIALFLPEIL